MVLVGLVLLVPVFLLICLETRDWIVQKLRKTPMNDRCDTRIER